MDAIEPFGSHLNRTVVAGLAQDGRDDAPLALADLLANAFDAHLALVHAYPYESLGRVTDDDEEIVREDVIDRLESAATSVRAAHVSVHAYGRVSPAHGLHDAARDLNAAVLVVGATHRGVAGRIVPGGVGERLLHGAPCPVAIAPAGYSRRELERPRIGVAFDGGAESRGALDLGIELAERLGGRVGIYTACMPYDADPDSVAPGLTVISGDDRTRHRHAHEALELASSLVPPRIRGDVELLPGRPEDALAEMSAEMDLLVCGSRGYGPLRTVLLGGVSSALAHRSAAPLMIVPRGAGLPLKAPGAGIPALAP
jgi:nucleotide-binding universal stress UspA family protein